MGHNLVTCYRIIYYNLFLELEQPFSIHLHDQNRRLDFMRTLFWFFHSVVSKGFSFLYYFSNCVFLQIHMSMIKYLSFLLFILCIYVLILIMFIKILFIFLAIYLSHISIWKYWHLLRTWIYSIWS